MRRWSDDVTRPGRVRHHRGAVRQFTDHMVGDVHLGDPSLIEDPYLCLQSICVTPAILIESAKGRIVHVSSDLTVKDLARWLEFEMIRHARMIVCELRS